MKQILLLLVLVPIFSYATTVEAFTMSRTASGNILGLVGHWTFDGKDMPQGLVKDVSGAGNHGSQVSMSTTTAYASGKIGQALRFDGALDV